MHAPKPVTFKSITIKAIVNQLEGPEKPVIVYYLGSRVKIERPRPPNTTYRWAEDISS